MMPGVVDFLVVHGWTLLAGASAVMALAVCAVSISRAPIQRQRLAELAMMAVLSWLLLAALPLPRPLAPDVAPAVAKPVLPVVARPMAGHTLPTAVRSELIEPARVGLAPVVPAAMVSMGKASGDGAPVSGNPAAFATLAGLAETVAWGELLAVVYLVGAACSICFLLLGWLLVHRILRRAAPPPAWLAPRLRTWASLAGFGQVRVLVSARRCRPFCHGLLAPAIVLPGDLCQPEREEQLRHVVLHELAHLRQRDSRGRALFALALPVLWFHPLFWLLRARAYLAAELLADDWAAGRSDARSYARALICLSERDSRPRTALVGAVSILGSQSEFYRRMKMLLQRETPLNDACSWRRRAVHGASAGLLVAALAGGFGVPAVAQDPGLPADPVRAERNRLAAEVRQLKTDIADLRKLLASAMRPTSLAPEAGVMERYLRAVAPSALVPVADSAVAAPLPPAAPLPLAARLPLAAPLPPGAQLPLAAQLPPVAPLRPGAQLPPAAPDPLVAANMPPLPSAPPVSAPPVAVDPWGVLPVAAGNVPAPAPPALRVSAQPDQGYLIDLVTRVIESRGEMQIAEQRYATLRKRHVAENASDGGAEIAAIQCRVAKQKYAAMLSILDAEEMACRQELEVVERRLARAVKLRDKGFVTAAECLAEKAQLARARSRLKMLASVR